MNRDLFQRRSQRVALALLAALALSVPAVAASYEWAFDSGNLSVALGNGTMTYADAATTGLTTFGTTDGTTVPNIGGQSAGYLRVPAFSATTNGYQLTFNDSGPNGGGSYINQYTLVFDVLSPGSINWTPFFNTAPANGNDADFYIANDGSIGIGALGYSAAGVVAANTWYRIAFAADLGAGSVNYYVNGAVVASRTGASLRDGRFALYSNADATPPTDLLLFNEGDTTGVYTHELLVNSIAFLDRTLTPAELAALGGPSAAGILIPEPSTVTLLGLGSAGAVLVGWRRRR